MKAGQDVIVVGSGAGGGACAWSLARRGLKVLLLEAGPPYDPARDYLLSDATWEQREFPEKAPTAGRQTFAPLQKLDDRWSHLRSWSRVRGPMVTGERRAAWRYSQVVGVGGSTLHFSGEAHRLNPASMKMATRFGVAADWPLTYAELEPYYCEAERLIGVAGPASTAARWRSEPCLQPPHPLSYASRRLRAGARRLGLAWEPNALAILSSPLDGRPNCNYCAGCTRGCPRTDKGSVDVTFVRKALATGNCTLKSGCAVTRLEPGARDRVKRVVYLDGSNLEREASAPAVVVACGAVETPRLLLVSSGAGAPDGLANESGQVGRNFMETNYWTSSGLHPEPLGSYRGLPADSICWDFNAPDAIPGVVGGCRFSPTTAEANLAGPINHARRVVGGWGKEHQRRMRETFGNVLSVGGIGEHLPNSRCFIDLDPEKRDRHGVPKARIHGHMGEEDIRRLEFMAKTCRDILAASGVEELVEEYGSLDALNATHVFGTCRMGDDPATSVVDSFGRSHRWKNLFITDASVFPSSGGGESPSLTIEALSLRTAEHLVQLLSRNDL